MFNKKTIVAQVGVGLSLLLLLIYHTDVFAQQTLPNNHLNASLNTTLSNASNSTIATTNNTGNNAFDQLKDTFGSLFGK